MKDYGLAFQEILDENEVALWADKPNKSVYILGSFKLLIFGLIWGLFDVFFFGLLNHVGNVDKIFYIFILLHSTPVWILLIGFIVRMLSYKNIAYCYTNKRIILKSGLMGVDYKTYDYDGIKKMEVNISPFEKLFGVGSIIIERIVDQGSVSKSGIFGIADPYNVFKALKKVSMDIKTDIYYPNDLRPKTNGGYSSEYTQK